MEENKHEYTGTWIPAHIMLDNDLHPTAKMLYAEINSFTTCFASNAWLAARLHMTESGVQKILRKLKEKGYVRVGKFDGRRRTLVTVRDAPASTSAMDASPPIDNSIDNSLKNSFNKELAVSHEAAGPPESFGSPGVNQLFRLWEQMVGYPIASRVQQNRYAASNLLKKLGLDKITQLLEGVRLVQGDRYGPRVADFCDLQAKLNALLAWGRTRKANDVVARF